MFLCCGCDNEIKGSVKGSLKHPYCEACFLRKFKGDYKKYYEWVNKAHKEEGNV
jgi:hypothetical protein